MSEIVVSCSCCGRQMVFPSECVLLECPACGTRNARPRSTGAELNILKRAVDQRLACDFHNAEKSYQHVLLEYPDEHEALWGLLLCHYGVEYVEDPVTHRRMPTVHTVRTKPLQAQADFRYACDAAPPEVRAQYELDAAYIDDAQAHIRQLAKSCEPYDVFLCHKTTKPGSSEKTEDYQRALELYYFLQGYGIRVFFAPMSLQSAAGANYEAGIYHALHTAKVMLVFCSDADHLTSAWVRSEWSRFLEMMDETQGKRLIPLLYDHFEPARLPRPFFIHKLQGLDMSKLDAPYNLLKSVQAAVGKAPEQSRAEAPQPPQPRPEPMKPQPEPAKAEAPRAGMQPPSQHYVTLTFPGLRDHWKVTPEWQVYGPDKKTKLADVKWNSTVQVSISSERTQLWFGVPVPQKSKNIFGILGVVFLIITLGLVSAAQEAYYDAGMYWFFAVYTGLFAFAFFWSARRTVTCISNIIVTSRKRYRLAWPWAKGNNKFKVEEY